MRPILIPLLCFALAPFWGQAQDQDAEDAGPTPQDIMELQAQLRFLGHDIDAINGIYGPQTTRAVEAFEFSVGMGDEGRLDEGEQALLRAQISALSYEKFGYRLRGYWSPLDCSEDADQTLGLWFDDLVWIYDDKRRFPLVETELSEPLLVTWEDHQHSLSSAYFSAVNTGADVRFFPLEGQILAVVGSQVFALNQCSDDLAAWPAEAAASTLVPDLAGPTDEQIY